MIFRSGGQFVHSLNLVDDSVSDGNGFVFGHELPVQLLSFRLQQTHDHFFSILDKFAVR